VSDVTISVNLNATEFLHLWQIISFAIT